MLRQLRQRFRTTETDFYHSRDYFQHRLEIEKKRADRNGAPLTVVELHIAIRQMDDRFTTYEINSSRQDAGELVFDAVRSEDVAAWYDADTLVILLPDTTNEQAQQCVQRLLGRMRGQAGDDPVLRVLIDVMQPTMYAYPDQSLPGDKGMTKNLDTTHDMLVSAPLFLNGQFTGKSLHNDPRVGKRLFDVMLASLLLLLLAPVMAVVAIIVKFSSTGPIIFRQKRVGYAGEIFTMFKFRSMHRYANERVHRHHILDKMSSSTEAPIKIAQDARVTRSGRWLRRTCLDELPQLLNVLRGDMSMVGPRPHPAYEADAYDPWYRRRLAVKPGMTGVWQVKGHPNMSYRDAIRMDLDYVDHWSVKKDTKVLLKTVPVVLAG